MRIDFGTLARRGFLGLIALFLAAPLIVYGLIFYLALGVLSRLMPQLQIFFIAMPANIMVGLFIFTIALGAMSAVWLERMQRFAIELN